jgi:hypothetical protein
LAGLLDSAELPNLKELFRDKDIGCAAVHLVDEKIIVHSELYGKVGKEKMEVVRSVSEAIDEAFRAKGVKKLHTWAGTDEQYRYNLFLGYRPTGEEVTFDGVPSGFFEFEKDL